MGLTLPSDFIVDVMRNADPVKTRAASARLSAADTGQAGSDFAKAVEQMDGLASHFRTADLIESVLAAATPDIASLAWNRLESLGGEQSGSGVAEAAPGSSVNEAFERMVLRNLYESMMPDSSSATYGEGPGADIWRSLAADQLAAVHAEAGGIGFGNLIGRKGGSGGPAPDSQWPYFSVGKIVGFAG
ncbi:hypothetical protein [Aestuariivirga sp.]|uniref:hypothetical protein n=1 Tax=Aestuariivirga sp. TaxID=2650926 RepID=UPI0035940DDF